MTIELYAHQERALDKLPAEGGYLAFEQGLGKTLTALRYVQLHGYRSVLVVCPSVAIAVWEGEVAADGAGRAFAPTGTRAAKAARIRDLEAARTRDLDRGGDTQYLVLNYEALLEPTVERAIQKWDPDLVIVDEAQKIKTATAKRSKVLHRLCKERPTLALSGTPITQNLLDLYSQYKAVDSEIWGGASWTRFKQRYAIMGGYGGYEVIGFQNTEELKEKIAPYTVVARKEDTLDLPTKTFIRVPVPLLRADWSDYREMATTGVLDEWVTSNPLERLLRLQQIAGRAKLGGTLEQVQILLDGDEQVVLFYRFREEGAALSDALGVPNLSGSTSQAERADLVDSFQAGRLPVFLSQITAGSTAITLTAASHMVYHSLSFAYEDWAQSQDRIHRIGQEINCSYYIMTATGPKGGITVDHLVLDSLERKEDIAALVTKDPDLLLV